MKKSQDNLTISGIPVGTVNKVTDFISALNHSVSAGYVQCGFKPHTGCI